MGSGESVAEAEALGEDDGAGEDDDDGGLGEPGVPPCVGSEPLVSEGVSVAGVDVGEVVVPGVSLPGDAAGGPPLGPAVADSIGDPDGAGVASDCGGGATPRIVRICCL
jgi:hypothetical protein